MLDPQTLLKCYGQNSAQSASNIGSELSMEYAMVPLKDPVEILNNNNIPLKSLKESQHVKPKSQCVDIEFKDVKFETSVWAMKKYKFGEY
ncbi:hypothetical protein GWI33_012077 [Rhynchophorus ferrugineus]|uniref:Uncharacterized protein n=1 Tax=Rhynchophorus ferrugineus TaxID=354439 RepID=A0A834IC06_RHYFE|nr:hypothetical protein GWI33_012077 [Rhynchophorus ferrugineus]